MTRSVYTPAEVAGGLVRSGIARLTGKYPFHARVLERFCPRPDPAVGTLGVGLQDDRLELVFCPEFVLAVSTDELGGVLLHEVMHVVLGHVTTDPDQFPDREARTIAEEVTVNEFIREPLPGRPILLAMFPKLPPNESTAQRYRRLSGRVPSKWGKNLRQPDPKEAKPEGESQTRDAPDQPPSSGATAVPLSGDTGEPSDAADGDDPRGTSPGAGGDSNGGDSGSEPAPRSSDRGNPDGGDSDEGVSQTSNDACGSGPGRAPAEGDAADVEGSAPRDRHKPGRSSQGRSGRRSAGGPVPSPLSERGRLSDDPAQENTEHGTPGTSSSEDGRRASEGGGTGDTESSSGAGRSCSRPPQPGLIDNHGCWPSTREEREVFRARLADVISDVAAAVPVPTEIAEALRVCGIVPGQGTYELRGESTGRLDWRQLLRRHSGRALRVEPRYGRPPRRFPELAGVVPGRGRAEGDVSVVAVVDTSASMSDALLEEVGGELRRLGRHHPVHVVECDCEVRRSYRFRRRLDRVEGRGGTDFRPPLEWALLRPLRPGVVIVFTDGEGPAPDRSPPVPVIWCLAPGGQRPVAWGRVVEMGPALESDEAEGTAAP